MNISLTQVFAGLLFAAIVALLISLFGLLFVPASSITVQTAVQFAAFLLIATVSLQALLWLYESLYRRLLTQQRLRQETEFWLARARQATVPKSTTQTNAAWNGLRKFAVIRKEQEAADICSFYLCPHDKAPLPAYLPGQYLTFQLKLAGHDKPVVRCYSLSDSPQPEQYRISIKQLPSGLVSHHFHQHIKVGDILDVRAPAGHFFLDLDSSHPVVLIGGGVGITPVLSMLNAIVASGKQREVWLFYGVRHVEEIIMRDYLESLRSVAHIHIHFCISQVQQTQADHYHAERVSVDLFKRLLPANNYLYYICGPAPMMQNLTTDLQSWGVPESTIHYEAFGPATVKQVAPSQAKAAQNLQVEFTRSGKTLAWTNEAGSLLELAEQHGIAMESGCRAGNCGTCLVAVRDGEVNYLNPPGISPEKGSCLTCVATPKTNLQLEA